MKEGVKKAKTEGKRRRKVKVIERIEGRDERRNVRKKRKDRNKTPYKTRK